MRKYKITEIQTNYQHMHLGLNQSVTHPLMSKLIIKTPFIF